jgi:hypothetical protein
MREAKEKEKQDAMAVANLAASEKARKKLEAKQKKEAEAAAKLEAKKNAELASSNPVVSAPLPVDMAPGSKQARLYDLLQRYKRDEITPTEYHESRAKILSEP